MLAARLRRVGLTLEHGYLERWCGGRALPWHRADLGFFGAHALSRCARVARMDSCHPLLATHFLIEKQVEAQQAAPFRRLAKLCGNLKSTENNMRKVLIAASLLAIMSAKTDAAEWRCNNGGSLLNNPVGNLSEQISPGSCFTRCFTMFRVCHSSWLDLQLKRYLVVGSEGLPRSRQ